ncbi:MAG: flagellar assembly protein FliH [Sphingomonadales bacterium]|nr:flagellar assembly protein FliH [Sphingomonadales bacterium]
MSGLIKGGAAHKVRPFLDPAVLPLSPPGDPRLEALARENDELRAALAAQQTASEQAVAAARADGECRGRADAGEGIDKRLALLDKGVEAAASKWQKRLTDLDELAPALARAALGKLFDDKGDHSRFVAALIANQLRLLRRESVLAIRVSALDFEDEQALAGLAAEAGSGSVRIVTDADLESGECRIDLQLGHIDVGAKTQWAQLAAFLDELAGPETGE